MKLSDLEAHFIRYQTKTEEMAIAVGDLDTWRDRGCPTKTEIRQVQYQFSVETIAEAQGIFFLCPLCFQKNGNSNIGTHGVTISFDDRSVAPEQGSRDSHGHPTRWKVQGSSLENLTLSPSVHLSGSGGCGWHGWIKEGQAR